MPIQLRLEMIYAYFAVEVYMKQQSKYICDTQPSYQHTR